MTDEKVISLEELYKKHPWSIKLDKNELTTLLMEIVKFIVLKSTKDKDNLLTDFKDLLDLMK